MAGIADMLKNTQVPAIHKSIIYKFMGTLYKSIGAHFLTVVTNFKRHLKYFSH